MTKLKPKVIRGGKANTIGDNLYYMTGRKHSQGGIDIGADPKTGIEVESGEVVQTSPKELRVFSAQPIIEGQSPAKLVMGGNNPNDVFNAQERYKDINGINDDGTKMKCGGRKKEMGGLEDKIPNLLGEFRGRNEGRTIKTLRRLRNDPNYQGTEGNIPSFDNSDKINELTPIEKPKTIVAEEPKKVSFNTAFANARKQGLKEFTWNGKQYGTKLANETKSVAKDKIPSYKLPEVVITASKPKTNNNQKSTVKTENNTTSPVSRRMPNNDKPGRAAYTDNNGEVIYVKRGNEFSDILSGGFNDLLEQGRNLFNRKKVGGRAVIVNGNVSNRLMFGGTPIDPSTGVRNTSNSIPRGGNNNERPKAKVGTKKKVNVPKGRTFDKLTTDDIIDTSFNDYIASNTKSNVNVNKLVSPVPAVDDIHARNARLAELNKKEPKESFMSRNDINTTDLIGLGTNLAGTIFSGINSRKALNNMEAPTQPIPIVAERMKTDFNISPQLGEIEEQSRRMTNDINSNTSSSKVRLQRLQRVSNQSQLSKNALRGQKENIETQLINQDKSNRQSVSAANIAALNDWNNRSTTFRNSIREQKASSLNQVFSGINAGVQDLLARIENRRNYKNTLGVYEATHPNVDRRLFTDKGVKF